MPMYIGMNSGAVYDLFGNTNSIIYDGQAILCNIYIPNTIQPILYSFTVNNLQQLTLFFTQHVDVRTIDITQMYVQNAYTNPTAIYTLSQSRQYFISNDR